MKRVLSIVRYFVKCANAILEGFEVTATNWPAVSPFSNNLESNESQSKPIAKVEHLV